MTPSGSGPGEALALGGRTIPEDLVLAMPIGRFIATYSNLGGRFKVNRGGQRIELDKFHEALLTYQGITAIYLERTPDRGGALASRTAHVVVNVFSTRNPLPGLAERTKLEHGRRRKSWRNRHSRKDVDYVFKDEVKADIMKSAIGLYYKDMAKPSEIDRLLHEFCEYEDAIAERNLEPVWVPMIERGDAIRTAFEETLTVTAPLPPEDLEQDERQDYWRDEFRRIKKQYGLSEELMAAARRHRFVVKTQRGPAILMACFRLECETLPQYRYRFGLEGRPPNQPPRRSRKPISFSDLLADDGDPFAE